MKRDTTTTEWSRKIIMVNNNDNKEFAKSIIDSLGLMGWSLDWKTRRDSVSFNCIVRHPGADYKITYLFDSGMIMTKRFNNGFWVTFSNLHFFGKHTVVGTSIITKSLKIYQNLMLLYLIFAITSGIYLWVNKKSERKAGVILLTAVTGTSFLFMIYIWLIG